MFTDMVGYSALSQKDESLALRLLEEHRTILRRVFPKFSGKEIETAGDSFFVEFASAFDAARCAVQIQKILFERNALAAPEKSIRLRIGLHVGDVVHRGKQVHGDGVNIAARIEPCAPAGGICVSEDVARQLQNKPGISMARLGKGELKNIQLPINIYRIVLPWEKKRSALTDRVRFFFKRKTRYAYSALALLIVLIGLGILSTFTTTSADRNSIAILPFKNLSEEKANEYFSDGITEDVIAHLSKISKLKVICGTSVMQYKNSSKNLRDIGRELNVATILVGSVRRDNHHVRVVAQLLDAHNDQLLWSGTYDKELTQIFAIQTNVAKNIADTLKATMSPHEEARLEEKATESLEAYDLYLQGRFHWSKRIPDELKSSIYYFERAIEQDSTYAIAYAGLADAYTLLGNFSVLSPREAYPKARRAAEKALRLNADLADAHTALAFVLTNYDWNWSAAEKEFKRALELNPSSARAHGWYSLLLAVVGRSGESFRESSQSLELDPLSAATRADAGLSLYFTRKYDKAIEYFKGILEIDPTFAAAYIPLGGAYEQLSMYDEALEAFSKASMFSGGHPLPLQRLDMATQSPAGKRMLATCSNFCWKRRAGKTPNLIG